MGRPDSRASHYTQASRGSGYGGVNGNYGLTNGQFVQQQFYEYERESAKGGMW